jgi:hypothetical protein
MASGEAGGSPQLLTCEKCGTEFEHQARACPVCGAEPDRGIDETREAKTWLVAGVILAVVGLFIFGFVLGPLAFLAGYKAYELAGSRLALSVMGFGFLDLTISVAILLAF